MSAPPASPAALFESLTMDRTPDGGLRIEAPPGAAEQLVELFAGMARLLEEAQGSVHRGSQAADRGRVEPKKTSVSR
jgi:hypothetical protein